jgi:hypothetical protein
MTDVRLTATNPEDSSVVPVACNSRGELLVTEPVIQQIDNDVTINGGLTVANVKNEEIEIKWKFLTDGQLDGTNRSPNLVCYNSQYENNSHELKNGGMQVQRRLDDDIPKDLTTNGDSFVVSARIGEPLEEVYKVDWEGKITASNVVFQLEETNSTNYSEETGYTGPVLNVKEELQFLCDQVRAVMERLKMTPEGGWPVWDGSTET